MVMNFERHLELLRNFLSKLSFYWFGLIRIARVPIIGMTGARLDSKSINLLLLIREFKMMLHFI